MDAFAALADPVRRDLVVAVARRGPSRVVDLAAEHSISRPAISRHLRLLTESGVLEARDHGRERHYGLRAGGLAPVREWLRSLTAPPVDALALDSLDLEVRRTRREREAAVPDVGTDTADTADPATEGTA